MAKQSEEKNKIAFLATLLPELNKLQSDNVQIRGVIYRKTEDTRKNPITAQYSLCIEYEFIDKEMLAGSTCTSDNFYDEVLCMKGIPLIVDTVRLKLEGFKTTHAIAKLRKNEKDSKRTN